MAKQRAKKVTRKPSVKRHKLKTSKKLLGVRTLRPTCTAMSTECGLTH